MKGNRCISAERVFLADGKLHSNKEITVDPNGRILKIADRTTHDSKTEFHQGILVPGFVNTHCHLELSHMKGKVDTGTGLLPFIESVVKTRGATEDEIQEAISKAEEEMIADGIVAVGDISNQTDTFKVKSEGRLRYYTFVECFDFMQESDAQKTFNQYKEVYDSLEPVRGGKKSFSPHAPYSMSPKLYKLIRESNLNESTISIHNQETPPEDELFYKKTGGFIEFYAAFGISLDSFEATGRSSIHSIFPHLNPINRLLFVHNTLTTVADIKAAHAFSENVYWATCPNANMYIENRLPNYQYFLDHNAKVTIGTDSLTSNWQLSILEEMKTIQRYQSFVPLETLITWATINGARALGFDKELGAIEEGKSPGIVLIEGVEDNCLTSGSSSRRLI